MGSENTQIANRNAGGMTIADDHEGILGMTRVAAMSTQIQMMTAMVDKKIATARMFPRSIARFKEEASALLREDVETARSAEYAKPVGGGTVRGPSVRLAEVAALCWTNLEIKIGEPIVGDKSVTVIVSVWDLQRNTTSEGIATTSIINKNGQRYQQSMIETAVVATAAKARRNAILTAIPRTYINDLLAVAKEVASGNREPLETRRQKAIDYFARTHKVTPEQICETLNIGGVDDIGDEELDTLTGIMTAIKEGDPVDSIFKVKVGETASEKVKRTLEQKAAEKKSPAASKPTVTNPMPD